jgi:RND family efflux transporter MFP subunit
VPVVYPSLGPAPTLVATRAHERLAREHEHGSVCTVPLFLHAQPLGAITFERARGSTFDAETSALCDAAVALLAPVLELKRREDRVIGAKVLDSVSDLLARLFGPAHLRSKLLTATLCAVLAFMALANGEFRVSATAVLEGSEHRALVAPLDGYIRTARAQAGDVVKQGQLLATLDTRALEIERRKLASEHAALSNELRQAIGELNLARVQILEAEKSKAEAQLSRIEEQLARTRIEAPFAGFVVSGDLSRSLGAPVERGEVLFEIAPLDGYRVALRVQESDLAYVAPGQSGQVALSSFSNEPFPFVVEQIVGAAQVEQGRNVFRVDARLEATAPGLRPGMNGVAKISVEQRKLIWIWTRELLQRARVWLWSHLP